jgi:5'(3')-deoxyribonucleotidase
MKKIIFLDLDGVLVNFSGGLCKLLRVDPYGLEARTILKSSLPIEGGPFGTKEEIDKAIQDAGYDFWYNLKLNPWALNLIYTAEKYGEVFFLTSPGPYHAAAHAKLDYIYDNFGSRNYVLTEHKYLCAAPNHILIDDMDKNLDPWKEHEYLCSVNT